ncbi:MAG: hypothetical protein ABEJ61_08385 [Haloferacaceae archaeon]
MSDQPDPSGADEPTAGGRPPASADRPDDPAESATRDGDSDAAAARERMRRGIRAVRREGRKAALIYATVDAVLALLLVNLLLRVTALPSVPSALPVPGAAVAVGAPATVDLAVVAGVVAGIGAFGADLALRLRRPLVERFESVNPEVSEALRTARDAVEAGRESRMATRLYDETVERLGETSSLGLLDLRRIAVTILLVALLAPASVHVVAVDYQVTFDGGEEAPRDGTSTTDSEYEGLQNPDQVLGDPEDVRAGDRSIDTTLPTQGSGSGNASAAESYDSGGYAGSAVEVESQQAGFAEQERLEDAELIREYNLRIREEEERTNQ